MVFGAQARTRLAQAQGWARDPDAIAGRLIDQGLVPAVRDVSFEVGQRELFVIMGLSGSGKSTLVRCLARIVEATAGQVLIDGEDLLAADPRRLIEMRRHTMGMVFQHFGLFPNMTVLENVAFPLRVQGVARGARLARAAEILTLVGLDGKQDKYPRELSGGQQQRVGIARSLAVNPAIWFLDEPFSALDPLIRRQLQDEFLHLQRTLHKSIVFITHDFGEALRLADRIAIMRDGRIVQIGTPADIVLNPADRYVADFARDIPRARLMTVGSLMTPTDTLRAQAQARGQDRERVLQAAGAHPPLPAAMPVEQALSALVLSLGEVPVEDGQGTIIGVLSPQALARALGDAATALAQAATPDAPIRGATGADHG